MSVTSMESICIYDEKVIRGKQRIAIYESLNRPRTGQQILALTREVAPLMTYQDLRHTLRDFQRMNLIVCLNPECKTGRLYVQSEKKESVPHSPLQIDLCAKISRAKIRLAVLQEVAYERFPNLKPLTATQIKKYLRDSYPMGLNHTLAALKFLETHQLVQVNQYTEKRELKIYHITSLGKEILQLIGHKKNNSNEDSPYTYTV